MSQPTDKAEEQHQPKTFETSTPTSTSGPSGLRLGEPEYISSQQHEDRASNQGPNSQHGPQTAVSTHDYVGSALEAQAQPATDSEGTTPRCFQPEAQSFTQTCGRPAAQARAPGSSREGVQQRSSSSRTQRPLQSRSQSQASFPSMNDAYPPP